MAQDTIPADSYQNANRNIAAHLALTAVHEDKTSGELWVHKDLLKQRDAWEAEKHIAPPSGSISFGDVESFAKFVEKYGDADSLVTWNATGLYATLDYHRPAQGDLGVEARRASWSASYPFRSTPEWSAWLLRANNKAIGHRETVEFLEDHSEEIASPQPAELMRILRNLRGNVSTKAQVQLNPDGTSAVQFNQERQVRGVEKEVEIPSEFTVRMQVLKGHVDDKGDPKMYGTKVRLRATVDESGSLEFRMSMPAAEKLMEQVYAEQVNAAKDLLPEFQILRKSDH